MVAFQRICICVVPLYMGRDLVAPGQDLFTIGAPDGLNRDMLVLNVAISNDFDFYKMKISRFRNTTPSIYEEARLGSAKDTSPGGELKTRRIVRDFSKEHEILELSKRDAKAKEKRLAKEYTIMASFHEAILRKDVPELELLFSENKLDINYVDANGNTAVHLAAEHGSAPVLQFLLSKGADPTPPNRSSLRPLYIAARFGHDEALKVLLDAGCTDFNNQASKEAIHKGQENIIRILLARGVVDRKREELVSRAIENGNEEMCKTILEFGVPVNSGIHCRDELVHAASGGHASITKILVNHKSYSDSKLSKAIALFQACLGGHLETAKVLLTAGADPNGNPTRHHPTPLEAGFEKRHMEIISLLLSFGAQPHFQYEDNKESVIERASASGDLSMVKLLLSQDVRETESSDTQAARSSLDTALAAAVTHGQREMVSYLLERGANVKSCGEKPLRAACKAGYIECIRPLLRYGVDLDLQDQKGVTALMLASRHRSEGCLKPLLQHGANANLQDESGDTALIIACRYNDTGNVELLLQHWANANLQDKSGNTALMRASVHGIKGCLELLLRHGANANLQDKSGDTALMIACRYDNPGNVELLLQHRANANLYDKRGKTALILASEHRYTDHVKLLLQYGANANLQDESGDTALMIACRYDNPGNMELLLQHGANANLQDKSGDTALMIACRYDNSGNVELLLQHGANANLQDKSGYTALMRACRYDNTGNVELLLQHGADADVYDKRGNTALMVASYYKCEGCVRLLLEHGANTNYQDCEGKTALTLAMESGAGNIAQLLHQHEVNLYNSAF
ncbi:MAG: hypothetical protein LQ340_006475 [Diploschistes diacapsis]|nr:MAG: hypothetical protein LQ340_006475 [Diploschistes diacapsis]